MQALMVIALTCMVHSSSPFQTYSEVDVLQKKCQKDLIACYEAKFPKAPPTEDQWVGALKDCVKGR